MSRNSDQGCWDINLGANVLPLASRQADLLGAQDAAGFKAWLQTMSKNVAEASSEGGFLGIGGVQVSDA